MTPWWWWIYANISILHLWIHNTHTLHECRCDMLPYVLSPSLSQLLISTDWNVSEMWETEALPNCIFTSIGLLQCWTVSSSSSFLSFFTHSEDESFILQCGFRDCHHWFACLALLLQEQETESVFFNTFLSQCKASALHFYELDF